MAREHRRDSLKAGSLLLDPKNSRIPSERRSDEQRHLLHALLEHEDIRGLATQISKNGLYAHERLIVMPTGKRFTVLEGNRRLAAIRLLLNPELAQTNSQVKHFRRLSGKTDVGALGKLDVIIVNDRIEAAPIIAAIHTKESKKRWSSLQQSRFYAELASEGQSAEEIATALNLPLGQVKSNLRTEKLYRLAISLDHPPEIRRKIDDPKFPATTLERFIESKAGRTFLGLSLDDEKGFVGTVHPDRFRAALRYITHDIATHPRITRELNTKEQFEQYVAKAETELPKTKKRGSFNPDDLLSEDSDSEPPTSEPTKPKPKPAPRKSTSVVPSGFQCTHSNARIQEIFRELKAIKIATQRNSTGVMLRVLMDIALWTFYKDQNLHNDVCHHFDQNKKQRRRDSDWTPSLRDLISYAVDNKILPGVSADEYKSIRSLASRDRSYFITLEAFNAFTHNPHATPTEDDLRTLWHRAEPLLNVILNPPRKPQHK